jgi:sensor histidine kinase YesM
MIYLAEELKFRPMKSNNARSYFITIAIISAVFSFMEFIPSIIYNFKGNIETIDSHIIFPESTGRLLLSFFLTFLWIFWAFFVNYLLVKPYRRNKSKKRIHIVYVIAVSILAVGSFGLLLYYRYNLPFRFFLLMDIGRSTFTSLIATAYNYFVKLNYSNQTFRLENEILKKENIKSQYEALKNELSPHFLFNSLNALQALIRENPESAQQYIKHLSSVLRYTLKGNEMRFVTLKEELDLASSFIFLLEMRYGTNLTVDINIPEEVAHMTIPPLTLQLLIENAVKHNEISKRNPLKIVIQCEDPDTLVVSNNLQAKISPEPSLGVGLSNLGQRYRLLSGKDISIQKDSSKFTIKVPLIHQSQL